LERDLTQLKRLAFIGNSFPRRCGIATFTTDLQQAVAFGRSGLDTCIVAMSDHGQNYDYPPVVCSAVRDDKIEDYARAADILNRDEVDVVSLQHEFGIFGGAAGSHVLSLLSRLTMPVVTTFHTILPEPTSLQHSIMTQVAARSSRIVAMSERGRDLLRFAYDVRADKIEVIPHGIPDFAFVEPDGAKAKLGFSGRAVILTFGLLSLNKGIEIMIDAMPAILERCPNAVYVVLGATHPNLVREQGEAYRERLVARVRELGIEEHVVFFDQFVELPILLEFIAMCDVYVTPYRDEAQITSGTLAYSFGLGKAIISTPYGHARELLVDGRGILVPFGDARALGREVISVLTNQALRNGLRARAYSSSRPMTWKRIAERYLGVFEGARRPRLPDTVVRLQAPAAAAQPQIQLDHFLSMCDDTGIFQHAIHSVPDRAHGYCVDDNARALLLACALNAPGEQPLPDALTARLSAFVQHAWNPDNGRFRNFMSFSRNWLEDMGSEDSHGRALWALGECARSDTRASRRRWAAALFAVASEVVPEFRSPRAWAFTLLGLDGYCAAVPSDANARLLRQTLADRLMALLSAVETADWVWFEDGLAYDNARLCQALLVSGAATGTIQYVEAGARTLRWLMAVQTAPEGHFRPVGSNGFGEKRTRPQLFDQQPLEAAAAIAACRAASRIEGGLFWMTEAERAFDWFLGRNDLSVSLVDPETGSCCDGLHPDRPNANRGGESVLSYLLGLADMRRLRRTTGDRAVPMPVTFWPRAADARNHAMKRGPSVTNHLSEPAGFVSAAGSNAGDHPSVQTRD
jgi:glycosyltransferase involved in cell wall biosynthesis